MKLTGSYEINADQKTVWEALNNPDILKKSIPGCEEFKKVSDVSFSATATNKIGPFNATFSGNIELHNLKPPDSYKIIGEGNSPVGFASGEAFVKLVENNGITKLIYTVEVNVGGKIAQVGSRLIDMTAKKMADIFFGNFTELISESVVRKNEKVKPDLSAQKNFEKKTNIKKFIFVLIVIVVFIAIYHMKYTF